MSRYERLYRSRDERMIWGVCGGIANYFDVDPTVIRVIAVLTLFLGAVGLLIYPILTIVMPLEPLEPQSPPPARTGLRT